MWQRVPRPVGPAFPVLVLALLLSAPGGLTAEEPEGETCSSGPLGDWTVQWEHIEPLVEPGGGEDNPCSLQTPVTDPGWVRETFDRPPFRVRFTFSFDLGELELVPGTAATVFRLESGAVRLVDVDISRSLRGPFVLSWRFETDLGPGEFAPAVELPEPSGEITVEWQGSTTPNEGGHVRIKSGGVSFFESGGVPLFDHVPTAALYGLVDVSGSGASGSYRFKPLEMSWQYYRPDPTFE